MKVMIMAGGTGGHIFPAAAVAQAFSDANWQVRWLGSTRGMEGKLVPEMGFEFCGLPVTAWHGGKVRKLLAPFNMLRALWSCFWLMRRENPDVVIGFGGYASAPGGVVAVSQGRPLVLHEQNGVPGLTNTKLARRATKVLQAFPNTFLEPYEVVGNPVRKELCRFERPTQRGIGQHRSLRILVLGGSQGAQAINELMPEALAELKGSMTYDVWHQCGKNKSDDCVKQYRTKKIEATVVEFIQDMAAAYQWADLVIARSGASTVSELAAVGVYSLLIPYPWHDDKQQYKNAQWLADADASECIEQSGLTAKVLANKIQEIDKHRDKLVQRAENAWKLGIRNSAERVFKVVDVLLKSKEA